MIAFLTLVVLIAALIVVGRIAVISSRLRMLEEQLGRALKRIADLESLPSGAAETPRKAPPQILKYPDLAEAQASLPGTGADVTSAPLAASSEPRMEPKSSPVPLPQSSRTKEEWEALIGGKLLNRIGALALILGVGFFLQYAFVNNWITQPLRVLIGFVVGALLLVGAARTAARGFQIFSQGLVGSGIAVLYLSVYASFNYYHLVSQGVAFLFMAAVTVVTFTQAFRYDSVVVALLGWLGGFLTPFLLSTGEVNPGALFTYLALLDAGLLIIAWKKDAWMSIEPLSLAGTYLLFSLWVDGDYTSADFALALLFLGLFWGMFHAVHMLRLVRGISTYRGFRLALAIVHVLIAYGLLYRIVDVTRPDWRGATTLIFALLYMATAAVAWRRSERGETFLHATLSAIALMVLATVIEFAGLAIISWWAAEALLLVWIGVQLRVRLVWYSAFALFLLALLTLLGTPGAIVFLDIHGFTPLWNQRAFTFGLLAAAIAGANAIMRRGEGSALESLRRLLHYQWWFLVLVLLGAETNDLFRHLIDSSFGAREESLKFIRILAISSVWALYGFTLCWSAVRKRVPALFHAALATLGVSVVTGLFGGLVFIPIQEFTPVANFRALAFAILAGSTAFAAFSYGRSARLEKNPVILELLHYAWCALVFILITVETNDYYGRAAYFAGTDDHVRFMRLMMLPAVWTLCSLPLARLGLGTKLRPLTYSGLSILILASCVAGLRGLSFEPVSTFQVVANERFFIILLVIAGCALARRFLRGRTSLFGSLEEARSVLQVLLVVLVLVLLTGEIWDAFAHDIAGISPGGPQGANSDELSRLINLRQLAISSAWLLYSIILMAAGLWRRMRSLRVEAMVLFGVSILKIFIYDLSFLDTLYRIFSFLALGVILLAVSYLYQRYGSIILGSAAPPAA